jgi:hypothetical protein
MLFFASPDRQETVAGGGELKSELSQELCFQKRFISQVTFSRHPPSK